MFAEDIAGLHLQPQDSLCLRTVAEEINFLDAKLELLVKVEDQGDLIRLVVNIRDRRRGKVNVAPRIVELLEGFQAVAHGADANQVSILHGYQLSQLFRR